MKKNNIPILLVILSLFISIKISAANYFSIANGNYNSSAIWSRNSHTGSNNQSAPCSCSPNCSIKNNNKVYIAHNLDINCNLNFSNNTIIRINSGGMLTITGNINFSNKAQLIIETGAVLNITGNMSMSGLTTGTIDGLLNVSGNLTGGDRLCGSGVIQVGSIVSGTPCPAISLPISLSKFIATTKENYILINWTTSSEINNDYFTVERSVDGMYFEVAGTIKGAGNSTVNNEYSLQDFSPVKGKLFYKIKQTDFDGKSSYSTIIKTEFNKKTSGKVIVYPNPLTRDKKGKLLFTDFPLQSIVQITLFDVDGNKLFNSKLILKNTNTVYNMPVISSADNSSGIYYLTIINKKYGININKPLMIY